MCENFVFILSSYEQDEVTGRAASNIVQRRYNNLMGRFLQHFKDQALVKPIDVFTDTTMMRRIFSPLKPHSRIHLATMLSQVRVAIVSRTSNEADLRELMRMRAFLKCVTKKARVQIKQANRDNKRKKDLPSRHSILDAAARANLSGRYQSLVRRAQSLLHQVNPNTP